MNPLWESRDPEYFIINRNILNLLSSSSAKLRKSEDGEKRKQWGRYIPGSLKLRNGKQ